MRWVGRRADRVGHHDDAVAMVDGVVVPGFATIYRNADGSFGEMQWTDLVPPVVNGAGMAFADTVAAARAWVENGVLSRWIGYERLYD